MEYVDDDDHMRILMKVSCPTAMLHGAKNLNIIA